MLASFLAPTVTKMLLYIGALVRTWCIISLFSILHI